MEIWKIGKNRRLYKSSFRTRHTVGPVVNFSHSHFPVLCVLVQEELSKKTGRRWIVFSKAEVDQIFEHAQIYVNPEGGSASCMFLDLVLTPVKMTMRKPFTVTYVAEDAPNNLPLPNSKMRLVIQIES